VIFIEVKSYKKHSFLHPLESITVKKQKRLLLTAKTYMTRYNLSDHQYRFDIIIIENGVVKDHLNEVSFSVFN